MSDDRLILVIVDRTWANRLVLSPNVTQLEIDEELGSAENRGLVSIPENDPAAAYVPNPDDDEAEPTRFQVYSGNTLAFAGLIDKTTSRVDANGIFTFGGIQRGGELAERNFGRRDMLGWPLPEVFRELLRDNIGRAPFATASASSFDPHYPPVSAITGEPQAEQYWMSTIPVDGTETSATQHLLIDLGSIEPVNAIRVIPEWATGKWYQWRVYTSTDNSSFDEQYDYDQPITTGDRGVLVELTGVTARWIRVSVYSGSDYARIACVLTYQNLAEPGGDTTYASAWIENDDSGNVTLSGSSSRPLVDGAFAGDGILGNSYVTQLNTSGSMTHTFRGISNAVYFTEEEAATVDFYVDDVLAVADVEIPANSYQYKGFEVTGLTADQHTLRVVQKTGDPQVDYFSGEYQASYRIVQENGTMIGYTGPWQTEYHNSFSSYGVKSTVTSGSMAQFPYYGDTLKVRFTRGPGMGKFDWYIDDAFQSTVDLYNASTVYEYAAIDWTGDYEAHVLRIVERSDKNGSSSGYKIQLDNIEGNWAHNIYLRSASDNNLALIGRLSEMTNTFMRLNYDGTVDLLGAIGVDSGEIIREGENEGGNIEEGEVEGDWSNAVSAILALGRGTDNQALRVFVYDKPARERLGIKVAKIEAREVVDAYLLVRQAWQTLQDSKFPARNYTATWSD